MIIPSLSRSAVATSLFALCAGPALAIGVSPSSDATALANTLFLNIPGLQVTDAELFGEFGQAGTYNNATGTYGLPNTGIMLSSGNVSDYGDGPNTVSGNTTAFGNAATAEQEALLGPITGQPQHFDPVQLNIDFNVGADISEVSFFGAFGSEEWPEFVGSFVDGFGLFVNGVNVAGVQPTGGGANLPVNIDHPDMSDIPGTELDGILAPNGNPVLRFDVPVNPGQINTFEILVADANDSSLDTTAYLSSFISQGNPGDGGGPPPTGNGTTEFNPILPSNPPDPVTGEFVIEIPEALPPGETVWIDPPVSVGYEYEIVGGPAFDTVTAPSLATVPDLDGYTVTVGGTTVSLASAATLDFFSVFGVNPTVFTVEGIDPNLMLDPSDPLAFPLGVSLTTTAFSTTVNITPITGVIPLPAGLPLYLGGLLLGGAVLRTRRASRNV